jgi:hypothetical protein
MIDVFQKIIKQNSKENFIYLYYFRFISLIENEKENVKGTLKCK